MVGYKKRAFVFALLCVMAMGGVYAQGVVHPATGTEVSTPEGLKVRLVGRHQQYARSMDGWDADINSPKSINIHPNGSKYYVNSLEGCRTIAYDMATHKKLAVINHRFDGSEKELWAKPSGLYNFTHYGVGGGFNVNAFMGKPVESCFTHGGRYLWVPYYRRSFDINAQDPSAIAVIDTEKDSIIRMLETGPLPKMIATSHDGKTVAVSHWGNNTVALIDVSSSSPADWHHKKMLVVDYILPLNYSTTVSVDRDNGSGYALRGTVFTPDDRYLLVGCMGGTGGIAVIDLKEGKYLGRVKGMMDNVRHLVIRDGYLYLSINAAGCIQKISLDEFLKAACQMDGASNKLVTVSGWQTCKVGTGARTIELSPSGRYAFAACNNASKLCVVDTREMKLITSISADSYPVGLDISEDGRYVIITSQGRSGGGGNAVDIFEVTYPEPEPLTKEGVAALNAKDNGANVVDVDSAAMADGNSEGNDAESATAKRYIVYAGGGLAVLLAGLFAYKALHKKG